VPPDQGRREGEERDAQQPQHVHPPDG
jgi:hypothetical protein